MSIPSLTPNQPELELNLPSLSVEYVPGNASLEYACRILSDKLLSTTCVTAVPATSGSQEAWDRWWHAYLQGATPRGAQTRGTLRVADLFSGPGGLSLGVSLAGQALGYKVRTVLAADVDQGALEVHQANHDTETLYNGSVKDLVDFRVVGRHADAKFAYTPEPLGNLSDGFADRVDVLVAGPPCQGHSSLNNHSRGRDPRNRLFLTVPALGIAWNVPTIIIENVPAVVRDSEGVVQSAERLLRDAGYQVSTCVLHAHKLGWPQTRRRFFMVASLLPVIDLFQVAESMAHEPRPVSWALQDLLEIPASDSLWDGTPTLSRENEERIRHLFDEGEYDLPLHKRPESHRQGTTYTSVYGRMKWDQPSGTITTGFMTPGRGRFIHPLKPRVLTPHEAARLQGFPDTYNFFPGSTRRQDLGKWIGDAVPTILGFAAGLSALGQR